MDRAGSRGARHARSRSRSPGRARRRPGRARRAGPARDRGGEGDPRAHVRGDRVGRGRDRARGSRSGDRRLRGGAAGGGRELGFERPDRAGRCAAPRGSAEDPADQHGGARRCDGAGARPARGARDHPAPGVAARSGALEEGGPDVSGAPVSGRAARADRARDRRRTAADPQRAAAVPERCDRAGGPRAAGGARRRAVDRDRRQPGRPLRGVQPRRARGVVGDRPGAPHARPLAGVAARRHAAGLDPGGRLAQPLGGPIRGPSAAIAGRGDRRDGIALPPGERRPRRGRAVDRAVPPPAALCRSGRRGRAAGPADRPAAWARSSGGGGAPGSGHGREREGF